MIAAVDKGIFARTLLIGASGFVGRYLAAGIKAFAPEGCLVSADRSAKASVGDGHVVLNLLDQPSIDAALAETQPTLVYHLAGQASVAGAASAERDAWRLNAVGSLELALALNRHAPTATLVFASSAEVYGEAFLNGTVTEQTLPRPKSIYGRSKLCAEQLLATALSPEARLLVMRPTNHVGPGQDRRFALPSFAAQIAAAEADGAPAVIRVGNLEAQRDFMDVRDVATAYVHIAAAARSLTGRETFNLASGTQRSLSSMLQGLRSLSSIETSVAVDPTLFREAEIPTAAVDPNAITSAIGWSPARSVDTTLLDILEEQRRLARRPPA